MIFLFFPAINFINNDMRMDINLYFFYGLAYHTVGCISFLLFAIIGDYIQFRILFVILSTLLSISVFMATTESPIDLFYFPISIIASSFVFCGFNVIFDVHIMKVYGMKNFNQIWGIIRAFGGISEIFGIIFNFIFENNSSNYKIIYRTIACLNLFSLILSLFETDDKFNYDK